MASDFPLIDLSNLPSTFEGEIHVNISELKKLREACQELGFFHIINHGMDTSLIQTTDSVARDMFSMPQEDKERAISPIFTPLRPGRQGTESSPESMLFPGEELLPNSVDQISAKLWPQGNKHFRETVQAFTSKMMELAHRILKLVILSLGLGVSKHYSSDPFGSFLQGYLRMNYYYNPKEEEANVGSIYKAHTDLGGLSILYEDNVGGLQMRAKDGKWINSMPIPGSLVVNLGVCLQMWSNGRYRSAEHRVVYGGLGKKESRLSIAFFLNFMESAEIRAPEELIDDQHPQKYRAMKFTDLAAQFSEEGPTVGGLPSHFLI